MPGGIAINPRLSCRRTPIHVRLETRDEGHFVALKVVEQCREFSACIRVARVEDALKAAGAEHDSRPFQPLLILDARVNLVLQLLTQSHRIQV
jgi:hypothetical protein